MKKTIVILMALVIAVAVTACSSHSHIESENWEADASAHWKLCEECGEKLQAGDHVMGDDVSCTVCGSTILDFEDLVSVYAYDEHGNMIKSAEYDADGNLISESVNEYDYDADGNPLKCKETVDGRLSSETEYTVIGGESVVAKYTYYYEDGSKFVNEYDGYGNVVLLIDYNEDGTVTRQTESQYAKDDDGEWYERSSTDTYSDGAKIEAEYDRYGYTTSRVIYDVDGNITSSESWEYTYDENGFITVKKEYSDGVLGSEAYFKIVEEDDGGRFSYPEIVTTYGEDGSRTVCVYDENNELVSETRYDADGNVIE